MHLQLIHEQITTESTFLNNAMELIFHIFCKLNYDDLFVSILKKNFIWKTLYKM